MAITEKDVRQVADLARLELTPVEIDLYTAQLQKILGYVESLSALDTTGVEPTFHAAGAQDAMRGDALKASVDRDGALSNAPSSERGCFKVPKIIE